MQMGRKIRLFFVFYLLIVACSLIFPETSTQSVAATQVSSQSRTLLPSNPPTSETTVFTSTSTQESVSFIPSSEASNFIGETAAVRIDKAFCSYRPDINGAPTFCNDKPYPKHTFTLLVWEEDWSHLDGKCLIVEGEVSEYDGKPQIIAENIDQVSLCE